MVGKDTMKLIAESNRSVISGIDEKDIKYWSNIYIMGREYKVPSDLTIMQAMEYSGYKLTHSVGCRAGFCGACSTIFRIKGDYRLGVGMACQTKIVDGMYIAQIPFSPAEKIIYDINSEEYKGSIFLKFYPEIARCLSCNTCTKACPQDIEVMDYIQAALRGDFKRVAELSFDCIKCGLCAIRCPSEIVQYEVAQLGRRMYGKNGIPEEINLKKRIKELENGEFEEEFKKILKLTNEELKTLYIEQQKTKEIYQGNINV